MSYRQAPLLTNVVVAHNVELLKGVKIKCPHHICQVRLVDLSETNLSALWQSNQIAEARQFGIVIPESLETKYVSFSSYRMQEKTLGAIGHHDVCRLVKSAVDCDVYAPYLIKNTLERLLNPSLRGPPYALDVPPIYEDLLKLCADDFLALTREPEKVRLFLMCNTFACSTNIYREFHDFITRVIEEIWSLNQFNFDWKSTWSAVFPNRETGLLVERATALWFSQHEALDIHGPTWGNSFPRKLWNYHPRALGWRGLQNTHLDPSN